MRKSLGRSKCNREIYCQFLLAAQKQFSSSALSETDQRLSHDSISRWLRSSKFSPKMLWEEVEGLIDKKGGFLILDDSVLAKPHSREIELTKWQYSGNQHKVIRGINLLSLLWTKDKEHIPVDFRVYNPSSDGRSKNDHFRDLVALSVHRGLKVKAYVFDTWYSSVNNLKWLNKLELTWVSWLRSNRIVDFGEHLEEKEIPKEGLVVHLRAVGFVKVFKIVHPNTGDIEYLATNDLNITLQDIKEVAAKRWNIEEYHRGLKQTVHIEHCQSRAQRSQRNHIFLSLRSFVTLEYKRLKTGISWYQIKQGIIQSAMRQYLEKPTISLNLS